MRKIITVITVTIFITFILRSWWESQLSSISADKSAKVVVVAKGAGVSEIAKQLKEENLIKSELAFKVYIKKNNLTNRLQAGSYQLSPSQSVPEIVRALQKGSADIWVTLIEGWRNEEMAEELSSKFNSSMKNQSSKFLELAEEGYMFPDTYLFPKQSSAEYIANVLQETFDDKFTDDLKIKMRDKGLTEDEGVILASIVEREARSDEARKMVASILLKRFKIAMGLNADATVQYALGYQPQEKSWWKRHLSSEDLKVNSLYNTYIHVGLPPGPIANPGLSSLKAVANADPSTPYLYYYHDSKGLSHYAKTLEEHNQNVATYP